MVEVEQRPAALQALVTEPSELRFKAKPSRPAPRSRVGTVEERVPQDGEKSPLDAAHSCKEGPVLHPPYPREHLKMHGPLDAKWHRA